MSDVPRSFWRTHSRQVIWRILETLPASATLKEKKAALRAAYPFERRENHPYRVWCEEVRDIVGGHMPQDRTIKLLFWHQKKPWWLDVDCGMCGNTIPGGCLQCLPMYQRIKRLVESDAWQAWTRILRDDFEARLVFADWLEERDWPEVADLVRATEKVRCKKCKGKGTYTRTHRRYGIVQSVIPHDCTACNKTGEVLRQPQVPVPTAEVTK